MFSMRFRIDHPSYQPGDIEFESMGSIKLILEEVSGSLKNSTVEGWSCLTDRQQGRFWDALKVLHDLASYAATKAADATKVMTSGCPRE